MQAISDLTKIHAIGIYSALGSRIIAQYYDNYIKEAKRIDFENEVVSRIREDPNGQVMVHDFSLIVYRSVADVLFFIVGDLKSNDFLLDEVLQTLQSALSLVYKKGLTADNLVQQIDLLYLLLDETIEQGFLFECDPEVVAARALLKDDNAFQGRLDRGSY